MKKVLTQRHQNNAKNVSASPDLMMKMLSGNMKYTFSRSVSCTHRRICVYGRYAPEDVLLWGQRNIGKKIIQSSRFSVLADFYIKVFGLRFVIMKFFKSLTRRTLKSVYDEFFAVSTCH